MRPLSAVYEHSSPISYAFVKHKNWLVLTCSGSWKDKHFKDYNFESLGGAVDCGHLHPLLKVRSEFRQIFLEMGSVISLFRSMSSRLPKYTHSDYAMLYTHYNDGHSLCSLCIMKCPLLPKLPS